MDGITADGGAPMSFDLHGIYGAGAQAPLAAPRPVRGGVPRPPPGIDPVSAPPAPALLAPWGAARALQTGVLPWRQIGGRTVIAAESPAAFADHEDELTRLYGPLARAHADRARIQLAVQRVADADLARRAESRTPADLSCRSHSSLRFILGVMAGLGPLVAGAVLAPQQTVVAICALALVVATLGTGLKLAAVWQSLRHPPRACTTPLHRAAILPRITILVPLFHEHDITEHLLVNLTRLRYPRDRLELCLVVEAGDVMTQAAIARVGLPPWIRAITVPPGACQTKPRALNYALDFTSGEIVGIYDAEDAPEPDQLLKVARRFADAPPDLACLQGALDYYNSRANWMARCFTLEYATWFRVVLPGIERLGLVIPLGGTTLFIRRAVLERLGAWDAQNVTEDADLGIRLARYGYRTEMIASTTHEEANARLWPWVKQRSRWLKGYAITYGVHMRRPRDLLRDLGWRRFAALQIQFGGTLATFLLAPALWSFWIGMMGGAHPFLEALPRGAMIAASVAFFLAEVTGAVISAWAVRRAGKAGLGWWAPTLMLYYPLATLAAIKGLAELAWRPFYWDKTAHGVFLPKAPLRVDQPNSAASSTSRVL